MRPTKGPDTLVLAGRGPHVPPGGRAIQQRPSSRIPPLGLSPRGEPLLGTQGTAEHDLYMGIPVPGLPLRGTQGPSTHS